MRIRYKNMNGKDKYGFYYVGIFNDGNSQITKTYAAAISSDDIYNSTIHPEILSLVFSPDIDEYCIILNGQI